MIPKSVTPSRIKENIQVNTVVSPGFRVQILIIYNIEFSPSDCNLGNLVVIGVSESFFCSNNFFVLTHIYVRLVILPYQFYSDQHLCDNLMLCKTIHRTFVQDHIFTFPKCPNLHIYLNIYIEHTYISTEGQHCFHHHYPQQNQFHHKMHT